MSTVFSEQYLKQLVKEAKAKPGVYKMKVAGNDHYIFVSKPRPNRSYGQLGKVTQTMMTLNDMSASDLDYFEARNIEFITDSLSISFEFHDSKAFKM